MRRAGRSWIGIRWLRRFIDLTLQRLNASTILMPVFGSFRRRRFGSKFAMAASPTSVGDVSPAPQGNRAEQNHRDSERRGRFWPFNWRSDSERAQSCEHIENPDEILAALFMLIEPGFSVLGSHR